MLTQNRTYVREVLIEIGKILHHDRRELNHFGLEADSNSSWNLSVERREDRGLSKAM